MPWLVIYIALLFPVVLLMLVGAIDRVQRRQERKETPPKTSL